MGRHLVKVAGSETGAVVTFFVKRPPFHVILHFCAAVVACGHERTLSVVFF